MDAGDRFQWPVRIRSEEDLSLHTVLSGRADGYTDILALRQFRFKARDSTGPVGQRKSVAVMNYDPTET